MATAQQELIARPAEIEPARPAITPMQMLQIAVKKGASLEQLSKLMDLQERWEANEARKAFVVAKAAFKAEAPTITKNKHVGFKSRKEGAASTDYNHATLDNVAETLSPILSKHGLTYAWETQQSDGGLITVTCVLTHVMGHSDRVSLRAGLDQSGNKNNIQAVGSTVTYLQRYTLLSITGMATTDQDNDGMGNVEMISPEQKDELVATMKETRADTSAFLKYFGVPSLDELPVTEFDRAVDMMAAKKRQGGAA